MSQVKDSRVNSLLFAFNSCKSEKERIKLFKGGEMMNIVLTSVFVAYMVFLLLSMWAAALTIIYSTGMDEIEE
jgi:hypothetical protein